MRPTDSPATLRQSLGLESVSTNDIDTKQPSCPDKNPANPGDHRWSRSAVERESTSSPRGRVVVAHDVVSFVDGYPLLAGLSATIERGAIVELRGPNGAGKTSLLRLLAGLLPVHRGSLHLLGVDVAFADHASLQAMRSQIGYVPHEYGLYGDLTPDEHLRVFGSWGDDRTTAKERRSYAESVMQLSWRTRRTPVRRLSAGQKRRTAFACAALKMPSLWLLDEPASGLDAESKTHFAEIIESERQRGAAVVYSTHDTSSLLEADVTWFMQGGCLTKPPAPTVQVQAANSPQHVVQDAHVR